MEFALPTCLIKVKLKHIYLKTNKSYKFRIYPNSTQRTQIIKTFGATGFVWNNSLAYRKEKYNHTKEFYSKNESIKDLTKIKKIEDYEWLNEVDSMALQQALIDQDKAYQNFFRNRLKGKKSDVRFKLKHNVQSYRTNNKNQNTSIQVKENKIKIPKLKWVVFRDSRQIQPNETIKSATIKMSKTNKFFVSILVEYNFNQKEPKKIDLTKVFSADMSAKNFMVSEEMEFENQKFYRKNQRRLAIRQRRLSKKLKGSNNRMKEIKKVNSFYETISNQRRGFQRNLAHELIQKYDVFCFDDLNIDGMKKFNSGLAKTTSSDFSWFEFTSWTEWLCFKNYKHFVKIDRFFPSSKMCSECGLIKEDLTLADRTFECECGFVFDRDLNAARNIKKAGLDVLKEKYKGINLLKNSTDIRSESYVSGDMSVGYELSPESLN